MKSLAILVKMQLKEQLNFKRFDVEDVNIFHIIVSIIGAILKFALVTGLCVAFLLVSKFLGLFSFHGSPVPDSVMSIVFTAMLFVSIISCVVGLTKSMYYARDNAVLLTLPCQPLQVYLSKLIIFFIFEIKRNLSFIVPMFIAYYITHSYVATAYLWMLWCILWISLFTVSIGAILSIPAMWIANFFRQRRWLQIATLVAAVGGAIVVLFYGIALIPENIDLVAAWDTLYWDIQDFLEMYSNKFSVLYDLTRIFLGESQHLAISFPILRTFLRFLVLMGTTIALLGLGLLMVKPLFYKMASTPFEYLKKPVKPKKNTVHSRRFTSVYTNFLVTVKNTGTIFSDVGILFSVPMLIFLLNKIFLAMKTRELGDNMIIAFNLLIILLVVLNSNCSSASIFSRDGRSAYLLKTHPSKYPILILTKLLPNTSFVCLSILATFVILILTLPVTLLESTLIILSVGMIYLAHMFYSAELDLMNPQNELYATVGTSETNPNETKATVTAFLISFVTAGVIFFLLTEGSRGTYLKLVFVALAALIYRIARFFSTLKLYYKEK